MAFELTVDDEAQPLTTRLNSTQFPQQGQVDWVSLSGSTIRFSLGVLSRLSAASIDPYTLTVGHFIGGSFELSTTGRKNIQSALSQLKSFGGLGQVLWFGFGIKNVVRAISVTEEGATLVALCAALSECFPDDLSAEILAEFLKAKGDFNPAPAVSEWENLIRACSGVFSTTSFPIRAETLMSMHVLAKQAGTYRALPGASSMADALTGLGNVSRGVWSSITIIGSREAGWIAALAEWLFGLTVITTDEHGDLKHSSCPSTNSHVNIIYMGGMDEYDTGMIKITEKIYDLRSAMELFHEPHSRFAAYLSGRKEVASLSGRVLWNNVLSVVFDSAFERLSKMELAVGEIIGSVARLFEAIAFAEIGVPREFLREYNFYCDKSMGKAFVKHTLSIFPELQFAASAMHKSCDGVSFDDALSKYHARIGLLSVSCGCLLCNPGDLTRAHSCLVVTIETIIQLGRLLSTVSVSENMWPLLQGVQRLFNIQAQKRRAFQFGGEKDKNLVRQFRHVLEGLRGNTDTMEAAICLFTGRTFDELERRIDNPCAISVGGICVYQDTLREVSDDRQLAGCVHVLPGRIEYNGRPFYTVEDKRVSSYSRFKGDEKDWDLLANKAQMSEVQVSVHETTRSLAVIYRIHDEDGRDTGKTISPFELNTQVLQSRGTVQCGHWRQHSEEMGSSDELSEAFREQLETAKIKYRELKAPLLGRCAALMGYRGSRRMILRERVCLQCCIKTGLDDNSSNIVIVSKWKQQKDTVE